MGMHVPSLTLFPYTTLFRSCSPFFPSARTCPAMNRPTYSWWMRLSQFVRMERNFSTVNFLPYWPRRSRSEEHTSELQSHSDLVCRLLLEKKKAQIHRHR